MHIVWKGVGRVLKAKGGPADFDVMCSMRGCWFEHEPHEQYGSDE